MFDDVFGDSSELARRQPACRAIRAFLPKTEEVDARGKSERVDVQATEPVRFLALCGQTPAKMAQTIVAKDSRLRHRQFLADGL